MPFASYLRRRSVSIFSNSASVEVNNTLLSVSLILAVLCGVFICVWLMEKDTIKGLAWVSGCAAVGTFLAVLCFKLHDMWDDLYKHCGEVYINNGTNT